MFPPCIKSAKFDSLLRSAISETSRQDVRLACPGLPFAHMECSATINRIGIPTRAQSPVARPNQPATDYFEFTHPPVETQSCDAATFQRRRQRQDA
eukprot:scaffold8211_cov117-Cylindrotheca_fusiformis.AAC.15